MPRHHQTFKPRTCIVCGKVFSPSSTRAKTCSKQCSAEYHRRFCFGKAREQAFLKPYDIEAFLAKQAEQERKKRLSTPPPPPPDKTPEPTSTAERSEQLASVNLTMSLPPSQRYQHSRIWSDFQRLAAIAIEKRRISDYYALADSFNTSPYPSQPDHDPDPPPPPHKPQSRTSRPSSSAASVPTLPPNLKTRKPK